MSKSVCFVIMPFGKKPDAVGRQIDFDAVYAQIIAPAIEAAGLDAMRADEELASGVIHRAMYERLILSRYAVADLTLLNANVYYELGVRHAARPQSTVLLSAEASRLPFDVGQLRAQPYALDAAGRPANASGDSFSLARKLLASKDSVAPDSPIFSMMDGLTPPQVAHEKTDLFRSQIDKAKSRKQKIEGAKNDVAALDALRSEMGDLDRHEPSAAIELFLAYRAVKAWGKMIELYAQMDPVLRGTIMAREQYGFALNRAGRSEEAEKVLRDLIAERGPSSETYGLLGRVYKDRWRRARDEGDQLLAEGFLEQAIEAYLKGFEADWRDAFSGVNSCTLMELRAPGDASAKELIPVVRYAAERKIARGAGDYWDYATLLELAVLERDEDRIRKVLARTLAEKGKIDGWSPESTAANFRDIRDARREKGEDVVGLERIIEKLCPGGSVR